MKIYKILDTNTNECFEVGKKSDQGLVHEIMISESFVGKGLHNDLTVTEITIKTEYAEILKVYGTGITIYYQKHNTENK